ncbi:MAG: hypothetical protein ACKVOK_09270 [Flavobacteriales bacterium]
MKRIMRVFAWIKLLICFSLILLFSSTMMALINIQSMDVYLILIGYFTIEMIMAIVYLRKYQNTRLTNPSKIPERQDPIALCMPLWYAILMVPLCIITVLGGANSFLYFAKLNAEMHYMNFPSSEILYDATFPAIFVLVISLMIVSFNILTAFRKIKPH